VTTTTRKKKGNTGDEAFSGGTNRASVFLGEVPTRQGLWLVTDTGVGASPGFIDETALNVLVIGMNFSPEQTGIAPYTSSLVTGLHRRGFRVRAITTNPHYPEWRIHPGYESWSRTETLNDVHVTRLLHYVPSRPEGVKRLLSEISFGLRVAFTRWGRPDVIVMVSPALFSSAVAMVRARLSRRKPVVSLWVQDIYSLGITEIGAGGGAVARIVTWVERATLRSASGVVVIHARFGEYLSQKLGIDRERIEVVRNWTHLDVAPPSDPSAIRAGYGWGADETVIVHAGNMGVKQGLDNVVRAARMADEQQLPLRFVLLGNGSQREALRALGANVKRLQFIESLSNADFQGALAAADVLLVNEKPGVSEMAVPSKLTSYFNAGRPVLAATDKTGVTAGEILASMGGRVVDADDPQALVDAALAFRRDPEASDVLGANGMRYRRDVLGEENAIDRFAQWLKYLTVIGGQRRGRTVPTGQGGKK